ncbi:MAG: hypothetical protein HYY20_02795 [Candidatus Tectomicrobia bacterium]|uniref:Blue (type 1) copper domain-containing protein n=1 Tax=Tectimicrobiota bacterium TaxID=2528274 RepID=A0A932CMG7_UNCTE|nr:hypothetical protein [Candidatus Tectomicrobia bacterium]
MKNSTRSLAALWGLLLAMALLVPTVAYASPPDVIVKFGLEDTTGPANHVLVPDEVTIQVGGKVAFEMHGFHQVTIYKVDASTTRDDIGADISRGANYVITDAAGAFIVDTAKRDFEHPLTIHDHVTSPLLVQGTNPFDVNVNMVDRDTTLNIEVTFKQAGRYLVFCAVKPHLDDQMFGFVTVEPEP